MKIRNFLFNYLSIPLLPSNRISIIFLKLILIFPFSYLLFYKYLEICLNKRENKRIVFLISQLSLRLNFPLNIYEIYLQALRNIELHKTSISISSKLINLYPYSDIGYWHLIHSLIAIGKVKKAEKILKLFKIKLIQSKRIYSLCLGNLLINKKLESSGIDKNSYFFNKFLSDSGILGQSLLKLSIKNNLFKESEFSLFISSHGGFSNTLLALLNTIALAKILCISEIYIIESNLSLSLNLEKLNFSNLKIKTCSFNYNKNFISGNFFSHFKFLNLQNPNFAKERLTYASEILNNYAYKFTSNKNELLIHIRSGDIFKSRSIHRKYGQPPLSYYRLCINHFKPESIRLIFEDFSNPVINLLINYINCLDCRVEINNDNSLRDDVSILLGSQNIVFGNGTFVPGILLGSKFINNIYIFEPNKTFKTYWSLERVNNIFQVKDKNGLYKKTILKSNWKASNSQLKLMKNYPLQNLKLNKI